MQHNTATDNNEHQRTYYVANVAPALVQHPTLSVEAKMVAITLLMHRNAKSGLCYVTQRTLARELHVSETRTVRRCLKELQEANLVEWDGRAAPRGKAKGRANSYDLAGLVALCAVPIRNAADVDGAETAPRDGAETAPHASGNRPITVNNNRTKNDNVSIFLSSVSGKEDGEAGVDSGLLKQTTPRDGAETTPHSAGNGGKKYRKNLVAPDGKRFADIHWSESGYKAAQGVVELAGGEEFNPGRLGQLCDEYGDEVVWFHAKWFPRRLASRRQPPAKVTPYFIDCVEKDYPVNPNWPEFHRPIHANVNDEMRAVLGDMPTTVDANDWVRWLSEGENRLIQDVPPALRDEVAKAYAKYLVGELAA